MSMIQRRWLPVLVLLILGVSLTPARSVHAQPPVFDHIFVVLMENHAYGQIIGSPDAPYVTQLAQTNASAGNYFALEHPSLGNYIGLTAGDTFNGRFQTDCDPAPGCQVAEQGIHDRIEAAGLSWRGYMEGMPAPCGTADFYPYVVRHDPWVYFTNVSGDATRCQSAVVPYEQLTTDLSSVGTTPSFVWITPDVCHDTHDCSIRTGDDWLSQNLPQIFNSPAWTSQNSLLLLTWDEDDGTEGNHVPMVAVGSKGTVKTGGYVSPNAYNHYSLLKTVEASWRLPPLTANDAAASSMNDLFTGP